MSIRPSVMVVDDEEEFASLFRAFLERSGFDPVSFTDPLSALDHFSRSHDKFSVVITDWKMPNLDGIHRAKEIREYNTIVKILQIIRFFTEDLFRKVVFQSYILNVFEKPFKLKEQKPRIEELC